ncbi:hypothetical protein L218DRAFT_804452, partial [Marasmius fiardii PR-910]
SWTKSYKEARWKNRLSDKEVNVTDESLLVLKTEFNLAWNYFSAAEIQSTMVDWWTEWLSRAETGNYSSEFPDFPSPSLDTAVDPRHDLASKVAGYGPNGFFEYYLRDIRKTNLLPARVLVSRKRTSNLFDLASTWKKSVVHTME